MNIIDSHAHIDQLRDIDECIELAKATGIVGIIAPGLNPSSNNAVLQLSQKYPGYVFPAIGYHPWDIDIDNYEEDIAAIEEQSHRCIAVGEIGLDYKAKIKKKIQKEVFLRLLQIAKKHTKPVIIHTRYVHETSYSMVKDAGVENAVFHGYNGSIDTLKKIIDHGYYVSAAPSVSYNENHSRAIFEAPIDNILIETDTPIAWDKLSSTPAHTYDTLKRVAKLKNLDIEYAAERIFANTLACFNLPVT